MRSLSARCGRVTDRPSSSSASQRTSIALPSRRTGSRSGRRRAKASSWTRLRRPRATRASSVRAAPTSAPSCSFRAAAPTMSCSRSSSAWIGRRASASRRAASRAASSRAGASVRASSLAARADRARSRVPRCPVWRGRDVRARRVRVGRRPDLCGRRLRARGGWLRAAAAHRRRAARCRRASNRSTHADVPRRGIALSGAAAGVGVRQVRERRQGVLHHRQRRDLRPPWDLPGARRAAEPCVLRFSCQCLGGETCFFGSCPIRVCGGTCIAEQ